MKTCKKCLKEKDNFETQKQNGKTYIVNICKDCRYEQRRNTDNKYKLFKIRKEYIGCIITDGKRYESTNLSDIDVIELREKGYGFIFKDVNKKRSYNGNK